MGKLKVGYSYWGFLGDIKMNDEFERISTPDGNAFYSWSIIKALQDDGNEVISIMPDRDSYGFEKLGGNIFSTWAKQNRYYAYCNMQKIHYYPYPPISAYSMEDLFELWDRQRLYEVDFILHEWRMDIPGRNSIVFKASGSKAWQPDLFIQECLVRYCKTRDIKLIIFDLDYKLTEEQFDGMKDFAFIIELGTKWQNTRFANKAKTVFIPFDFCATIDLLELKKKEDIVSNLVYVGNRYERDWCIDKYIPETLENCIVYGNWKEAGRDSETRWPLINFGDRLQTEEMYDVYSKSICTILLAKEDYCKYNFMTARLIEAVFYGTVPLFIEEYGEETIQKFAGVYSELLTVRNKEDVVNATKFFKENYSEREEVILYLRKYLGFMDAKEFVKDLKSII